MIQDLKEYHEEQAKERAAKQKIEDLKQKMAELEEKI
jgi:hypothetical protein